MVDAVPVGKADVVVLPQSNTIAAKKGGWQAAGAASAAVFTFLMALWAEPEVAAAVTTAVSSILKKHPEWAIYITVANVVFGFLRNRYAHRKDESRLAIVGDPVTVPLTGDRRRESLV